MCPNIELAYGVRGIIYKAGGLVVVELLWSSTASVMTEKKNLTSLFEQRLCVRKMQPDSLA